jgi:hypothetical protein
MTNATVVNKGTITVAGKAAVNGGEINNLGIVTIPAGSELVLGGNAVLHLAGGRVTGSGILHPADDGSYPGTVSVEADTVLPAELTLNLSGIGTFPAHAGTNASIARCANRSQPVLKKNVPTCNYCRTHSFPASKKPGTMSIATLTSKWHALSTRFRPNLSVMKSGSDRTSRLLLILFKVGPDGVRRDREIQILALPIH